MWPCAQASPPCAATWADASRHSSGGLLTLQVYIGTRLGPWLVPSRKSSSELREAGDYLGRWRPGQDDDCSAELSPRLPEGTPCDALQQC